MENEQRTTAGESGGTWFFANPSDCHEKFKELDQGGLDKNLQQVFMLEHDVPIGEGRTLHVSEHFSLTSWLRGPRRAVILLSGSVHKGSCWRIPVPGYDATDMLARKGFFVYTVDYVGTGRSYIPGNGLEVTMETNVEALRPLIKHVLRFRTVDKVDLVGEGYGGILATQLAADQQRISSCVMIALPYKSLSGGPGTSPEFVELLNSSPNGYFHIPPEPYDMFFVGTPPEVRDYFLRTQPGSYPTPFMTLILQEPPFFDPSVARVPGLLIYGEQDPVIGPSDPTDLAKDYGTEGAQLALSPQAGHAPRIESPEVAEWLWNQVFDFIDP